MKNDIRIQLAFQREDGLYIVRTPAWPTDNPGFFRLLLPAEYRGEIVRGFKVISGGSTKTRQFKRPKWMEEK